ncbi:MAG TPA: PDZ domain-containing protein [Polyangia bacterium]
MIGKKKRAPLTMTTTGPRRPTTRDGEPFRYRVGMANPGQHEFQVEMRVPALPERAHVELVFAAWAPGSYMIRDFVRHVYGLEITDERGRALDAERLDKQRWRVTSGGAPFVVRYRVFAFETSVRTSFLDDSHGYWNGTSLFFAVEGETRRAHDVTVDPPRGWHVSTALPGGPGDAATTFRADSYDELVDSPFEVGTHRRLVFRVGRTTFEVALYGRCNAEPRRLVDILRRVVRATAEIFGGFPFARYVFIIHALPVGSGGLEHHASVTMDITGLSFEDEKGYVRFADLAAHEFFHAWNVKRLHDPVLGPFDYTRENYTRMLWFHEGFTDYLANVLILRAGLLDEKGFWRWIAEDWPRYASRPGRMETPLDELSFEAWIKLYKPADNHFNSAVSYYEKGLWVGMALDLELRRATQGRRGLPELFRWLWDSGHHQEATVTEEDVRAAAAAVGGKSFDAFFERYVHSTDELALPALWRQAGLTVKLAAPWSAEAGETDPVRRVRARSWSGAVVEARPGGADRAVVKNVLPDSPAARAGLTFGDELVALDGDRVNAATFAKRLSDHPPGTKVTVTFFRRDLLQTARLTVGASPERRLLLEPDAKASATSLAIRKGWLGVPASGRKT